MDEARDIKPASLDVSLLSGIRADTCAHLLEAGITTLEQIVALQPEDLCQFRGIKRMAPRIHAHARAWVEQQPVWYSPLPAHCHQEGVYPQVASPLMFLLYRLFSISR